MNRFLALLLLFATSALIPAEDVRPGGFRREKGSYTFDKHGSVLEIITAKDGVLSLSIEYKFKTTNSFGSTTSSTKSSLDETGILKKEGWFVYFESPERIWAFNGDKNVTLFEHKRDGISAHSNVRPLNREILPLCPPQLLEALPSNVKKSLQ